MRQEGAYPKEECFWLASLPQSSIGQKSIAGHSKIKQGRLRVDKYWFKMSDVDAATFTVSVRVSLFGWRKREVQEGRRGGREMDSERDMDGSIGGWMDRCRGRTGVRE